MEVDDARHHRVVVGAVDIQKQFGVLDRSVFDVVDVADLPCQLVTPEPLSANAGITSLANSAAVRDASSNVIPPKATSIVM